MRDYTLTTNKTWSQTNRELATSFEKWEVTEWETNYPRGARLEGYNQSEIDRTVTLWYKKNGQTINLKVGKQARAVDNIRVLYIAVETMRMNERRGIGEIMESAYLQLNAGTDYKKSPYEILGLSQGLPLSVYEAMYKDLVMKKHPDHGGSEKEMTELNEAIKAVREELR